jgi:hypothetical protein
MRCVWKLLVLFAVLPVSAIGCGAGTTSDNVTQEELATQAAEDDAEEEADEEARDQGGGDVDEDEEDDE